MSEDEQPVGHKKDGDFFWMPFGMLGQHPAPAGRLEEEGAQCIGGLEGLGSRSEVGRDLPALGKRLEVF